MAPGRARRFILRRTHASSVQVEDREPPSTATHVQEDGAQRAPVVAGRDASGWRSWTVRFHWAVAALAYTAITLTLTFPLIFHLGDSLLVIPVRGDNVWQVWYLWWFRTAINSGQDPAYTHNMYALLPHILLFPAGYYNAALGYVLQWAGMSPLGAYNVAILLGFVLTGLTTYLLAGEFVRNRFACFVAGFLFSFCAFHMIRATVHLTLASIQWLPFCAWRMFVFYRRPTPLNAVWLGLSVALVLFTDIYYFAYFLLPFVALFIAGKLVADFAWFKQRQHLLMGGLAVLVAVLVAGPPLRSFVQVDPSVQASLTSYAQQGAGQYSADLLAFFLPWPGNPLLGPLTAPLYAHMVIASKAEMVVYLGWVALLLGLGGLLFRRNRTRTAGFWLVLGGVTLVLALGPVVRVLGKPVLLWGPYTLVYNWSLLSNFRAPARMGIVPLLALAVLAAHTVEALFARFTFDRPTRVALSYLVLVGLAASLAESLVWPFPMPVVAAQIPALYQQIGADTSDTLLLDLPVRERGSDLFYQTIHHKRLVGGYAIRTTYDEAISVENLPYIAPFDLHYGQNVVGGPDGAQLLNAGDIYTPGEALVQGLQAHGIGYVVLHRDTLSPAEYARMRAFLLRELGAPFYDSAAEGLTAWRIPRSAPPAPSADAIRMQLGSGWVLGLQDVDHHLERAVQQDGQVLIQAMQAGGQHIRFEAFAYFQPVTVVVSLNGVPRETIRLSQPFTLQPVDLGLLPLQQGQNILTLHVVQGCSLPARFEPSNQDPRCVSIGVEQVQATPAGP